MEKQLTRADILNAEAITLFDRDTIYVEPHQGEDVYGIRRNNRGWFLKSNYWEYYESELMLCYMERITAEDALRMIGEWERAAVDDMTSAATWPE